MHCYPRTLIRPLLAMAIIATLTGCCGCLTPPGMGGPGGGGARGPDGAEAGGRWRDAPPPRWQEDRERPGPAGQRLSPRRGDAQDGQGNQP